MTRFYLKLQLIVFKYQKIEKRRIWLAHFCLKIDQAINLLILIVSERFPDNLSINHLINAAPIAIFCSRERDSPPPSPPTLRVSYLSRGMRGFAGASLLIYVITRNASRLPVEMAVISARMPDVNLWPPVQSALKAITAAGVSLPVCLPYQSTTTNLRIPDFSLPPASLYPSRFKSEPRVLLFFLFCVIPRCTRALLLNSMSPSLRQDVGCIYMSQHISIHSTFCPISRFARFPLQSLTPCTLINCGWIRQYVHRPRSWVSRPAPSRRVFLRNGVGGGSVRGNSENGL